MLLYFRGFRQNAAYHVLSAHRLHLRHLLHTGSGCIFTAVCKLTALSQIGRVRHQSVDGLETLYLLYQVRDGCHQSLGVGMADILVNLAESEEEIELREMLMEQIKDEPATVEYVHNFLTNREEK